VTVPFTQWDILNEKIRNRGLGWSDIQGHLLEVIKDIDKLRREDQIEEGTYRQKGNRFGDTLRALIQARCGVNMPDGHVEGRTDRHDVDLVWIQEGRLKIAIEAKMIGSPSHLRHGTLYQERSIGIDIDKRIKEMKYTGIDLKRHTSPQNIGTWSTWRNNTPPRFAAALLMRLAGRNKVDTIRRKVEGLAEYLNAVGLALYREDPDGTLSWVALNSQVIFGIGKLVDVVCSWLER
jgi:hypothetical protein